VDQLEGLPGIGPKTAQRLAYYMLRFPQDRLERFAEAVERLKKDTKMCERCFNVDEESPCRICSDRGRNSSQICVVETPLDLLALERSDGYTGVYHVLHGVINPLNNIGPNDIYLPQLLKRIKEEQVDELIIATNPSMEGEATAMYIADKVKEMGEKVRVTRIGRGLPTGADLEYADDTTLSRAMEGRKEME
jgi:recombination protein RecR